MGAVTHLRMMPRSGQRPLKVPCMLIFGWGEKSESCLARCYSISAVACMQRTSPPEHRCGQLQAPRLRTHTLTQTGCFPQRFCHPHLHLAYFSQHNRLFDTDIVQVNANIHSCFAANVGSGHTPPLSKHRRVQAPGAGDTIVLVVIPSFCLVFGLI